MKNLTELVFILDRSGSSYSDVKRIITPTKSAPKKLTWQ